MTEMPRKRALMKMRSHLRCSPSPAAEEADWSLITIVRLGLFPPSYVALTPEGGAVLIWGKPSKRSVWAEFRPAGLAVHFFRSMSPVYGHSSPGWHCTDDGVAYLCALAERFLAWPDEREGGAEGG